MTAFWRDVDRWVNLLAEMMMVKKAAIAQQVSTTIQVKDVSYNAEFQTFRGGEEFDTSLLNVRSQIQN